MKNLLLEISENFLEQSIILKEIIIIFNHNSKFSLSDYIFDKRLLNVLEELKEIINLNDENKHK